MNEYLTIEELKALLLRSNRETWDWVRQLVRSAIERRAATS